MHLQTIFDRAIGTWYLPFPGQYWGSLKRGGERERRGEGGVSSAAGTCGMFELSKSALSLFQCTLAYHLSGSVLTQLKFRVHLLPPPPPPPPNTHTTFIACSRQFPTFRGEPHLRVSPLRAWKQTTRLQGKWGIQVSLQNHSKVRADTYIASGYLHVYSSK